MKNILLITGFVFFQFVLNAQIKSPDSAVTNSIGMKFILVKPGKMVVGKFQPTVSKAGFGASSNSLRLPDSAYIIAQQMAAQDAMPGFEVSIDHDFYIGQFEVTQEQWTKVMGKNPSFFQGDKVTDDASQHPVENITWADAQKFIKKLNQIENSGARYRLPSEFEWEYAARAGATDDISWNEIINPQLSPLTRQKLSAQKNRMHGDYMICLEMCGNG